MQEASGHPASFCRCHPSLRVAASQKPGSGPKANALISSIFRNVAAALDAATGCPGQICLLQVGRGVTVGKWVTGSWAAPKGRPCIATLWLPLMLYYGTQAATLQQLAFPGGALDGESASDTGDCLCRNETANSTNEITKPQTLQTDGGCLPVTGRCATCPTATPQITAVQLLLLLLPTRLPSLPSILQPCFVLLLRLLLPRQRQLPPPPTGAAQSCAAPAPPGSDRP